MERSSSGDNGGQSLSSASPLLPLASLSRRDHPTTRSTLFPPPPPTCCCRKASMCWHGPAWPTSSSPSTCFALATNTSPLPATDPVAPAAPSPPHRPPLSAAHRRSATYQAILLSPIPHSPSQAPPSPHTPTPETLTLTTNICRYTVVNPFARCLVRARHELAFPG